MTAYSLFVKHNIMPSQFLSLSAEEKALLHVFIQKELKDEKKAIDKAKQERG